MFLSLLSHSSQVNKLLTTYFQAQQIELHIVTHPSSLNYTESSHLILLEPSKVEGQFLFRTSIFKIFLRKQYPDINLIVLGMDLPAHPNCLDLYNLPPDFHNFLSNSLPVTEDWEGPASQEDSLEKQLTYFFKDHGNQSFIDKATYFKMTLTNAYEKLEDPNFSYEWVCDTIFPLAQKQWPELKRRWDMHIFYFQQTPFFPEIKKLDKELGGFGDFFESSEVLLNEELFKNGDFLNRFDQLLARLKEIKQSYFT